MYAVYEVYREGKELPEERVFAGKVVGELVHGDGRLTRYSFKTANVLDSDGSPLLGEMQYARVEPGEDGKLTISGFQKAAHIKDLEWRKVPYQQVWLCVPVKT